MSQFLDHVLSSLLQAPTTQDPIQEFIQEHKMVEVKLDELNRINAMNPEESFSGKIINQSKNTTQPTCILRIRLPK